MTRNAGRSRTARQDGPLDRLADGAPGRRRGVLAGPRAGGHVPPAEWAAAAVGGVLLLGTIGFLVYEAVRQRQPPDIAVTVERTVEVGAGHLVVIRAANRGDETAAELTVEGTLDGGDGPSETASITFDYLAPHSELTGGLVFARDPAGLRLDLRPRSYRRP